jgi:Mg2+ and Co2+ transporter CorA
MRVACRAIDPDGQFKTVEEEKALAAWRDGQGPFWIDLENQDRGPMAAWLGKLGIDQELVDLMGTVDSTGKVLPLDELIFFEYPVPPLKDATTPATFACLTLDRLVITMHDRPVIAVEDEGVANRLRLREPTTSGLVCALAVMQSARLRRSALSLRDRARELAATMDVDPKTVPLEDILTLKGRLLDVDRMVDEQLAVFDVLEAIDKSHLDLVHLAEFFHLAVGNVKAADRRLERLDRVVMGLQQRYESLQQEKTNRRLGLLTILSAIFMPLTFIAGVYGMNFDLMPELHFRYGYPTALGGMAVIAGALFWYFRSRGWLN